MRLTGYLSHAVLIAAMAVTAGPVRAEPSAAEAEIAALGEAWIEAEMRHDAEALEALLDERFLATFASGQTLDRPAFIEWTRKVTVRPQVTNESIVLHGDTAVVIGVNGARTVKFTWVAVKKAQRWRVVSETFSRLTAPKGS